MNGTPWEGLPNGTASSPIEDLGLLIWVLCVSSKCGPHRAPFSPPGRPAFGRSFLGFASSPHSYLSTQRSAFWATEYRWPAHVGFAPQSDSRALTASVPSDHHSAGQRYPGSHTGRAALFSGKKIYGKELCSPNPGFESRVRSQARTLAAERSCQRLSLQRAVMTLT